MVDIFENLFEDLMTFCLKKHPTLHVLVIILFNLACCTHSKLNFEHWIFHSVVICGPELCKLDGIIKTRLATNIGGYPLRLALSFQ